MEYCALCGRDVYSGSPYFSCPVCKEKYNREISSGIFPPGLDVDAREFFNMAEWMKLKIIEQRVQNGYITPDQGRQEMQEVIANINHASAYARQYEKSKPDTTFKLY